MNGFYISNVITNLKINDIFTRYREKECFHNALPEPRVDEVAHPTYCIGRSTGSKFPNDKVCYEDADYILLLEGVIYNSKALQKQYGVSDMAQLIIRMYKSEGNCFFDPWVGSFVGALYEKKADRWLIFTNKLASLSLFYYIGKEGFIVALLPILIRDTMREAGIPYTFCEDAAYLMMTYGFMGTTDTFVTEIKKLEAGHYLEITGGQVEIKRYHRFSNHSYDLTQATEEEIVEGIDQRFRRAIQMEYEKDLEAGYTTHLRALTGGTDSRAAAFVSEELGFHQTVNFTFGQPGFADERIAREISIALKNQLIFSSNSLENADSVFLRYIDQATFMNQGLGYYMDVAPSLNRPIGIDPTSFGLLHGAPFSEAFLTTGYLHNPQDAPPEHPLHTYCDLLAHKIPRAHFSLYENEDIYSIYSIFLNKHNPNRVLLLSDANIAYPGLNADLVEYCLSIPVHLRKGHYIYHKWLFNKYPQAKRYKLEKLNAKIDDGKLRKWWGEITRYGSVLQYFRCSKKPFPTKVRKRFSLEKRIKPSPVALFPFDFWYETDKESRIYVDRYFVDNLSHPVISDKLRKDLNYVYENATARPKYMAVTVLAAAKLFFDEREE